MKTFFGRFHKLRRHTVITGGVLAFAVIGTVLLVSSRAATPVANFEAEAGARSGNASVASDTGASGSSAVKFNAASSGVPNPLKIMPLGDSLTRGAVDLNSPGQYNATTINGYRLQLWNLLTAAGYHIDYVGSIKYGNASLPDHDEQAISGICIKTPANPCNGLQPIYPQTAGWLNTYQPDLVIMQGGGNDFTDPTMTNAKVEGYMESWIQLVWATRPNAKIIVCGAEQWYPGYEALLKTYVEGLQAQGKPIRFLPYANTIGVDANTLDRSHPNTTGYTMWGNQLAPLVEQLFPL